MSKIFQNFLIFCFLLIILQVSLAIELSASNEILIKFVSDDTKLINSFMNRIGANSFERLCPLTNSVKQHDISRIYKLKFSANTDIISIIQKCKNDPAIEYAQPNYLNHLCSEEIEPNDYFYPDQWALKKINIPEAWEIEKGSDDVIIAVVDTGVDYNHEDLKSRIWANSKEIPNNNIDDDGNGYVDDIRGWDFYDSPNIPSDGDYLDRDNDPMDEKSHGTIVAGIIGAIPDNSIGIAGITWNCQIMPLRAGNRYFEDDDLCSAIVYAVDNGANIINMSWGGDEFSYVIRDATKYAYDRGCVLVAAAGNDNEAKVIYPATFEHVISVGASDKQDKRASFSNYGAGIDIIAPGDRVFGTVPKNHYSDWSGTSMSAPVVSGVIALMLSKRPSLNNRDIAQILKSSVDKIDEPLFSGIGRINAKKALLIDLSLTAHISSPNGDESSNSQFVIKGTANGKDFRYYQLEYTEYGIEDWRRVSQPGNDQKFDDDLGVWDISRLGEGSYIVRLGVYGYNDLYSEDRITLNVDHTPPKLLKFDVSQRIVRNKAGYVIKLTTDDLTILDMYYRKYQNEVFAKISFPTISREHEIAVSDFLESGMYECFFVLANTANLISTQDNQGLYYDIKLQTFYLPTDGFLEIDTGIPAIYPISAKTDFDDDGKIEIIGMDQPVLDYATVRIFEKDDEGYNEVFISDDTYFPRDVSDSDKDGLLEILGNRKDTTFLIECPSKGAYPTKIIWQTDGLWGGQFADTDKDGNIEILSSNINDATIDIYENRGNDLYLRTAKLPNTTKGANQLAINFAVGDFDSDGINEIVSGDLDGDIFIYKTVDDDDYKLMWTGNIPDVYIKSLASGDFDGDGFLEFAVSAMTVDSNERASNIFLIAIFKLVDGDYQQIWQTEIASFNEIIGISLGDLDNDGIDELVVGNSTATYIFKYPESPSCIWYHISSPSYSPLIQDIDNDGLMDLMFNVDDKFMKFSIANDMSVMQPWGVIAKPTGESEIELRWNGLSKTAAYKIYRGIRKDNLHSIATLGLSSELQGPNWKVFRDNSYIDSVYYKDIDVSLNIELWYAIVAIDSDGRESPFSQKVSAMPNSSPQLLSAVYNRPSTIYVYFNEPMGSSAKNSEKYSIISKDGVNFTPSSAILDQDNKRILLTIEPLQNGIYTLNVSGIHDATGIPIKDSLTLFYVNYDVSSNYNDLKSVKVYPNPLILMESRKATFCCLPSGAKIRIFDINSQLVNSLVVVESDKGSKIWGLDNADGYDVSSGVYIYVIEYGAERKTGKIAVLK